MIKSVCSKNRMNHSFIELFKQSYKILFHLLNSGWDWGIKLGKWTSWAFPQIRTLVSQNVAQIKVPLPRMNTAGDDMCYTKFWEKYKILAHLSLWEVKKPVWFCFLQTYLTKESPDPLCFGNIHYFYSMEQI